MKRHLLVVFSLVAFVALLGVTTASAELSWEVGAKGGVSIAKFVGNDADSLVKDSHVGFNGGLFVLANVTDRFGVQLEGLYTQKGGEGKVDFGGGPVDVTVRADYIEFPLLAVFSYPASETVSLRGFVGPGFAFNTKAEVEGGGTTTDVKDQTKSFDFLGILGVGAAFNVGTVNIIVDGRYEYGFISVDDSGSDLSIKNSNFSIMGGVSSPLPMNK
jgi:hypothetical protein